MVGVSNMHVNLLGPVEVVSDQGSIALGGPKPRALLAMLALEAGSTVSSERLIDGLWGDDPPATASKLVQLYVSHLRKAMAACGDDGAIATRGRGYELRVERSHVDAARFERLLAQGAAREAIGLWRGPALADVAHEPFAAPEVRRLNELRTAALEVAIDQDLDAGRHREVLGELESLLAQEPLRERLHAQRMLALYRSGRQADALDAYRQARATLVEEIGVEPGPDLRRLHDAILRQDPSLDAPAGDPLAAPAGRPRPTAPLLGRDADLARLRRLWRQVRDGRSASVVVAGQRGIGKTRLALELAREVRRDQGDVVWCERDDQTSDALRTVADAPGLQRPTLVVLDDLDPADEHAQRAFRELTVARGTSLLTLVTSIEAGGLRAGEVLALEGLEPDAAARLARLHAGARDGDLPADRIAAETGGVPGLVLQAASEWTREQAMRRVGEAAARTSAERADWRLAGDDLATGVVELQELRERAALAGADRRLPGCPFKGLASFDVDDAPVFFGRERLVAEMVARVPGTRLMGVIGPSGSGKSSAMRAGLLAALAEGVLPGSNDWPLVVIRPGHRPLRALEQAVADLPAHGRWVLAVDQFEEVFTVCPDAQERAAFVDAVVRCARDAHRKALVIVGIRADFYGQCAGYPELSRMLEANHVLVGPMGRHELRRAIDLPAQYGGLSVEPELVDALIADVEGEPGGLPLLSTALLELWQQRDGRRLHFGAYEHTGGVRGAVARLAEAAYTRLDSDQQEQARRILLRLSGDGGVRARVPIGELGDAGAVLSVLADERLITIGEGEVEVAHEALLREWPRLRAWLEEDAEGRRIHRHLTHAARDFNASGRDPSELYRGSRLAAALEWVDAHEEELNDIERDFVAASRAAAELEADRQRRTNRRLRALLAGVGVLLAVAVVAGAVAVSQRGEAREAAVVADAQRVGAQALTNDRLDQALLLARAGVELHPSTITRSNLLAVLLRNTLSLGELRGDGWPLYSVALSQDDRLMAIGDERGGVTVYDGDRTRLSRYRAREGIVQHLAFSPDGATLAVAVHGDEEGSLVDLIDPRTGTRKRRVELPPFPEETFFVYVLVAFAPDGRDLVVQQTDVAFPDGPASVMLRLNAATGAVERRSLRLGQHAAWNLVTTADRRRVFVTSPGDDRTFEIDPDTLRVVRTHPVGDDAGAVSGDGRLFALGSYDGTVRLLDLRTGDVRRFEGRHEDGGNLHMAFTPDGRTVVTADTSGEVIFWDVRSGQIRERFSGHSGEVYGLAVSGDSRTLYSAATDARMAMWDLADDRRLDPRFPAGPPMTYEDASPKGLGLSPDGRTLAITQLDGTVDLLDARTLSKQRSLRALRRAALAVDFSPDGRLLAVTGDGARVTLWDSRTLRPVRELAGLERSGFSQALTFSPDGRLLAAGGLTTQSGPAQGQVRVWDTRTGQLQRIRFELPSPSLAFSPNGRLLAAAGMEAGTQVRDVRTGRLVARPATGDFGRSVAFSPDGKLLAIGHFGGSAVLLSTSSWKPIGRRLDRHRARVTALEFSPDGRRLVTGSADGTVRLWDTKTQQPIGAALTIEPDKYVAATFAKGGSHLFAVPHEGRGVRWDIRPQAWERHGCLVAGRELTPREWRAAVPGRPFRSICGPR